MSNKRNFLQYFGPNSGKDIILNLVELCCYNWRCCLFYFTIIKRGKQYYTLIECLKEIF